MKNTKMTILKKHDSKAINVNFKNGIATNTNETIIRLNNNSNMKIVTYHSAKNRAIEF